MKEKRNNLVFVAQTVKTSWKYGDSVTFHSASDD
jgi:hypothetical protein